MRTPPAAAPTIALAVIARNEAADLKRLLAWHRPLYDQAVVVDTGSTDASAEVADAAGALLLDFPWQDDFSAARNHALDAVPSGWVLVLDCDELIAPQDFARVRELAAGPPQGWVFSQWNYCRDVRHPLLCPLPSNEALAPKAADGFLPARTCRLFPARPEVRYTGVVHELPDPALLRAGLPLTEAEVVVHHYGHLVDEQSAENKNARYASLLRQKLRLDPNDPRARYEMAVQLVAEGQSGLACRLLQRTITEAPDHPETLQARVLWGQLLVEAGQTSAGVGAVEAAVRLWPAQREGWLAAVRLHADLGNRDRAAVYLQQGRYLFPADRALLGLQSQVLEALDDNVQAPV